MKRLPLAQSAAKVFAAFVALALLFSAGYWVWGFLTRQ